MGTPLGGLNAATPFRTQPLAYRKCESRPHVRSGYGSLYAFSVFRFPATTPSCLGGPEADASEPLKINFTALRRKRPKQSQISAFLAVCRYGAGMEEKPAVRPRTGPRYEPRSLLVNPEDFGRELAPEFVAPTRENRVKLAGAKAQHVLVHHIRHALFRRHMTVVQLAESTGLNYQRLGRLMRGTALMRMEDLGLIARVVPEAFDFVLGTATNPFHTGYTARKLYIREKEREALREEQELTRKRTDPGHEPR